MEHRTRRVYVNEESTERGGCTRSGKAPNEEGVLVEVEDTELGGVVGVDRRTSSSAPSETWKY
jgi:hypothetical protein